MIERPALVVSHPTKRALLEVLAGHKLTPPPIWLMRQAGRYLPEYRTVRETAGGFLNLCYTPELAAEVTLQPIRRFGFDAAILFADILVVPDALGQGVRFVEGEGPRLDPVRSAGDLTRLDAGRTADKFARVAETVARVRQDLPAETALIGFCGSPWTVATYMVGGRGTPDQADARLWARRDAAGFARLIELLVEVSATYLDQQIRAGADCVQLFDSWAGSLPEDEFDRWVTAPTRTMVAALKQKHPEVPVIGFPRGAGQKAQRYIAETGVDAIGCDTAMPLALMQELAPQAVVQGNLDPLLLVAGGAAMAERVGEIKEAMAGQRHIFNLGHGIVPETPPEHVAELVKLVRE
ncbi:MAG: uroporphyrinogen decarboxylase [Rhodospirillales bacterium]|nr:uroporphyrinogen decarboxylase [Rhodospirillales bacterium]